MALTLRTMARSDVGKVREQNEDSGYAGPRIMVVADGMGGHAAGEVASAVTVETLASLEDRADGLSREDAAGLLTSAIIRADGRIQDLVAENPARQGMGTTVTVVLWTGEALVLGHIGDSRAYRLRNGTLTRVTHDHTYVQSLIDEGRITEAQASSHPARSLLLRALDGRGEPEPDTIVAEVEAGDRYLICSDGLTGVVADSVLEDVLRGEPELGRVGERLVQLALEGGAPDNVTVVLADVMDAAEADSAAERPATFVGAASEAIASRAASTGAAAAEAGTAFPSQPVGTDEDAEILRYAPRPPRRFRMLRRMVAVVLVVGVLAAAAVAVQRLAQSQYFVATSSGQVATFRGLTQDVGPLGPSLLYIADDLPVEALPDSFRRSVEETIPADTREDAQRIIDNLRREACEAHAQAVPPFPGLSCVGVLTETAP